MSVVVAEGIVEITADGKRIPRQVADDISGNQGPFDSAGRRSSGTFLGAFGGSFLGTAVAGIATSIVSSVGQAVGTGLRAAVDFAMQGIETASSLVEAGTAIDQVFGEGSTTIKAFAETTATSIGQSELAALQAAQTIGVYGQAAGLAGKDNAVFSESLVRLASDFASFYDADPAEAIEAIGAGLRGESEPLRRFGVLLDDATLKARAMAMGIYEGTGSLTQQQRVLAAQAEILEQGAVAAGDFERTSGGLANQQRTLAAQLENSRARLGEALLPAMLQLTEFANTSLIPILNETIDVVGPMLGDALAESTPAFIDLILAVAPLIPDLVRLGTEAIPPVTQALVALSPLLIDNTRLVADIWTVVNGFFGWLSGDRTLDQFVGSMSRTSSAAGSFYNGARNAFNGVVNSVRSMANGIGTWVGNALGILGGIPGRVQGVFSGVGSWLVNSGRSLIQGFISGIRQMLGPVGDAVAGIVDFAAGFFPNSPAKRGPLSGQGWTNLGRSGKAIAEQFASGVEEGGFAVPISITSALRFRDENGAPASRYAPGASATAYPSPSSAGSAAGRGDAPMIGHLEIHEARYPLGSGERVSQALRLAKAGVR